MLTFHSTKKWRPSLFFQTLPTLTLCLPCLCSKLKPSGWFAMVFVCLFWLIYLWFSSESEEKCLDILRDERNCGCADKRPRGIFTFFSCVCLRKISFENLYCSVLRRPSKSKLVKKKNYFCMCSSWFG